MATGGARPAGSISGTEVVGELGKIRTAVLFFSQFVIGSFFTESEEMYRIIFYHQLQNSLTLYIYIYIYIDADLLTTRLAMHTLRTLRYDIKIRATVCCHLVPLTHSRSYFLYLLGKALCTGLVQRKFKHVLSTCTHPSNKTKHLTCVTLTFVNSRMRNFNFCKFSHA
jgi:hypothetical protein